MPVGGVPVPGHGHSVLGSEERRSPIQVATEKGRTGLGRPFMVSESLSVQPPVHLGVWARTLSGGCSQNRRSFVGPVSPGAFCPQPPTEGPDSGCTLNGRPRGRPPVCGHPSGGRSSHKDPPRRAQAQGCLSLPVRELWRCVWGGQAALSAEDKAYSFPAPRGVPVHRPPCKAQAGSQETRPGSLPPPPPLATSLPA